MTNVRLLVFLLFLFFPLTLVQAASLYFSPAVGSYDVGKTLTASVFVSSLDKSINAVSGSISFPTDKLEALSVSKVGSVISLWVQEPFFSNSGAIVNFEGIVLNPGFTGSAGKIITATFRVKAAGTASVAFSSGSVLANDGVGTNILTGFGNAQFYFQEVLEAVIPSVVIPSKVQGALNAPKISSSTHSDSEKWYSLNNAKFSWPLASGITGVRLLVGRIPEIIPTITHIPPVDSKEVSDLEDGVWYFHVRLQNVAGWGDTAHFRFQIDTKKPDHFEISEIARKDLTDPKAKFRFDASDQTSGIDYYEISIDGGESQIWRDDGAHMYQTPALAPGKHILIAKAFDKAGNFLTNSVQFNVESIKSPTITEYPKQLQGGQIVAIKGTSYPKSTIVFWLQRDREDPVQFTVQSDIKGAFVFNIDQTFKDGVYTFWAQVVDARGAKSNPSGKLTFVVQQPAFLRIGSFAISLLAILVPLVALLIVLGFILFYGWHRFSRWKKKIKKETREAEEALSKAFALLKEDVREQIKMLEKTKTKRQLTEEEEKIINQLTKDLYDAKKFVEKEIKDIEKELGK